MMSEEEGTASLRSIGLARNVAAGLVSVRFGPDWRPSSWSASASFSSLLVARCSSGSSAFGPTVLALSGRWHGALMFHSLLSETELTSGRLVEPSRGVWIRHDAQLTPGQRQQQQPQQVSSILLRKEKVQIDSSLPTSGINLDESQEGGGLV